MKSILRNSKNLLIFFMLFCTTAFADFAETVAVGPKTLHLNGYGYRKAAIFAVKVYRGALYLESINDNASAILESDEIKRVEMHFTRDVSADRLRNGWKEGLEKNNENIGQLGNALSQLNALMDDVQDGSILAFNILPDKVQIERDGKLLGTIKNEIFGKALLKVWLGKSPPNKDLKARMLGE